MGIISCADSTNYIHLKYDEESYNSYFDRDTGNEIGKKFTSDEYYELMYTNFTYIAMPKVYGSRSNDYQHFVEDLKSYCKTKYMSLEQYKRSNALQNFEYTSKELNTCLRGIKTKGLNTGKKRKMYSMASEFLRSCIPPETNEFITRVNLTFEPVDAYIYKILDCFVPYYKEIKTFYDMALFVFTNFETLNKHFKFVNVKWCLNSHLNNYEANHLKKCINKFDAILINELEKKSSDAFQTRTKQISNMNDVSVQRLNLNIYILPIIIKAMDPDGKLFNLLVDPPYNTEYSRLFYFFTRLYPISPTEKENIVKHCESKIKIITEKTFHDIKSSYNGFPNLYDTSYESYNRRMNSINPITEEQ